MSVNSFQYGQNTLATVNGVDVSSTTNSLSGAIAGLTLQFNAVTTTSVNVQLSVDQTAINKNIQDLVTAYNALNTTLTDATKYDAVTKTAGILQGDATVVGLKNAMISLFGSSSAGSTFTRLSDAGLELQLGGGITVNNSKRTSALTDLDNLKKLFKADNGNASTNGFALKIKSFATGLLSTDGLVTAKSGALDAAVSRNTAEQDKVNAHVLVVGARLKKQYSALDAQMANLTALNNYVTQQVAQWNKKTG
jgi:flagellar hook-associated protein 2